MQTDFIEPTWSYRVIAISLVCMLSLSSMVAANAAVDIVSGASTTTDTANLQDHAARFNGFADELGLTGQQRTDIQIIVSDYATRFGDLAKIGRTAAATLLNIEPTDPEYRTRTDETAALAATSAAESVILLAELRAQLYMILTPEQRGALQQKLEAARQKHIDKHAAEPEPAE